MSVPASQSVRSMARGPLRVRGSGASSARSGRSQSRWGCLLLEAVCVAVGVLFAMASVPNLFVTLTASGVGPDYLTSAFTTLGDTARDWSRWFARQSFDGSGGIILQIGLFAVPMLWAVAAARSVRMRSWRPFAVATIASTLGLIGIPAVFWLGWLAVWIWRIVRVVSGFIGMVLSWVIPTVLVVAALVFLYHLAYRAITAARDRSAADWYSGPWFQRRARRRRILRIALWTALAPVALLIAGLTVTGVLDDALIATGGLLAAVWHAIATAAMWVGAAFIWAVDGIQWALALVARLLTAAAGFVLAHVVILLAFNQLGRVALLPIPSALKAGAGQGKCADTAAGIGMAQSLLLTAAVLDPVFRAWFIDLWQATPVFEFFPTPVGAYEFLLPGWAESMLRPVFTGFAPLLDLMMLLVVVALATWSLWFAAPTWGDERGSKIVLPTLTAIGTALVLPVLALAVWFVHRDD